MDHDEDHKRIDYVFCDKTALHAELVDGRVISVPLAWYPRLEKASQQERAHWKLVGKGYGVHWPDIDEDISIDMILSGIPSLETQLLDA